MATKKSAGTKKKGKKNKGTKTKSTATKRKGKGTEKSEAKTEKDAGPKKSEAKAEKDVGPKESKAKAEKDAGPKKSKAKAEKDEGPKESKGKTESVEDMTPEQKEAAGEREDWLPSLEPAVMGEDWLASLEIPTEAGGDDWLPRPEAPPAEREAPPEPREPAAVVDGAAAGEATASEAAVDKAEAAAEKGRLERLERAGRVLIREEGPRAAIRHPEKTTQTLLIFAGAALAVVGMIDVLVLWVPPLLGNAPWRFGTVGQTLDALPATYLGLAVLVFGVVRHPRATAEAARAASIVFGAVAALILVAGVVYATAVPSVLGQAPTGAVAPVVRSVVRVVTQSAAYFAASVLIARMLWRSVEKR